MTEAYKQGYESYKLIPLDCPYSFTQQNVEFHEWCDGYDAAMRDEDDNES